MNNKICWFCLLLLAGCKGTEQSYKEMPASKPQKKLVMMLCDLTSSNTDSAITRQKMKHNVEEIFRTFGPATTYYVYPVGKTPGPSLFKGDTGDEEDPNKRYVKNARQYIKCLAALDTAFLHQKSSWTCIIDCLEAMEDQMIQIRQSTGYDSVKLIILSDMMEACMVNNSWINLEKTPFNTGAANNLLTKWPSADRQFLTHFNDIDIVLLFNTNQSPDYTKLRSFWKKFFKVAGYQKEVLLVEDYR